MGKFDLDTLLEHQHLELPKKKIFYIFKHYFIHFTTHSTVNILVLIFTYNPIKNKIKNSFLSPLPSLSFLSSSIFISLANQYQPPPPHTPQQPSKKKKTPTT